MPMKKAAKWIIFWIGLAVTFNIAIYFVLGEKKALEFLGGYIIEQSLSVDNLFLFLLIFNSFGLSSFKQRRVLNYGIAGAILLRFIFIILGVTLVSYFHWILNLFGLLLIVSGIKIFTKDDSPNDFKDSKFFKLIGKIIPFTKEIEGDRFFIWRNRAFFATPLFAILILIEASDIIFAIDSIPAIFSITTDTFIIFSSNIFAILGLRNMYFVIERLEKTFKFVKYGVAIILVFTGVKLAILYFGIEINIVLSLGIIFSILICSILASIFIKEKRV
jgi:tellurite resistance protein TerC